jgi:cellobiose phosphorylase
MNRSPASNWEFIDQDGTFRLIDPDGSSYLYFPLVNEAGMMSAVTPDLHGDIKADHNSFLTQPVSVEDLHQSRAGRNFWVSIPGYDPWSASGQSALQTSRKFSEDASEKADLEAGILWHRLTRWHPEVDLETEIINFVPTASDRVELMQVTLTNMGTRPLRIRATGAIPIYGRSADDLRDHRHVTSLLQRSWCSDHGVLVRPTLSFDERGHLPNQRVYAVLGVTGDGGQPAGFFPLQEAFIGEGGSLDWPAAIVNRLPPAVQSGDRVDGYETMGGVQFEPIELEPGASQVYVLIMAILDDPDQTTDLLARYGSAAQCQQWLDQTRVDWQQRLVNFGVQTAEPRFDGWMRWVSVQPTLRRLFGNSFLPYHDYGRGGRGWRDLWQDILALLLMETGDVSELLAGNFAGVRIDGSNATIIGNAPGEFKADRNNIPRVWMDHGAWPLLTTHLYIDQSGDLDFLLRQQPYFKDHLVARSQDVDADWMPDQGTQLRTTSGEIYQGSILEHLLIQHLTPFFNVGEHNLIRLEGADWNDAMDMAAQRGESVAFSALYAGNLIQLAELVLALGKRSIQDVSLGAELLVLLDTLTNPVDYNDPLAKQTRLQTYFESCRHTLSGDKIRIKLADLAADLTAKGEWLQAQIRSQEWLAHADGYAWFNGYYDNDGQRVEGPHPNGVRMTLTGQVFALMGGVASNQQAAEIVRAADHYLYDAAVGGYRLNTDFGEVLLNLGRAFGFAFGHKENGAMFSHMAVMYAYALYQRGLVHEGYKVLAGIYQQSQDFPVSRMYPGIPEYFSPTGRGMYPYLTGSASWYLLTLVTEVFGLRGVLGDLQLAPRLVLAQFDRQGQAQLKTRFAGKVLQVTYFNPEGLDWNTYQLGEVRLDGVMLPVEPGAMQLKIPRTQIETAAGPACRLEVHLIRRS